MSKETASAWARGYERRKQHAVADKKRIMDAHVVEFTTMCTGGEYITRSDDGTSTLTDRGRAVFAPHQEALDRIMVALRSHAQHYDQEKEERESVDAWIGEVAHFLRNDTLQVLDAPMKQALRISRRLAVLCALFILREGAKHNIHRLEGGSVVWRWRIFHHPLGPCGDDDLIC